MGMQQAIRSAAVGLLYDYATDADVTLQVYAGRPRSIAPPTGFVDTVGETLDHTTNLTKRFPTASIILIHGIYDTLEAANQKDAFMDGFITWCEARYHAAGANTLLAISESEDLPNYVPEWMPPEQQKVYYATRITLEGYALIGS
ncbi:MAG: hypothetical protein V4510_13185, partial [bacterium]